MRIRQWNAALFAALLLAGPAMADGRVEPGELELARALAAESLAPRYEPMVEGQRAAFAKALKRQNKGREAEVAALFDTVALPSLKARWDGLVERRAEHMAMHMTLADLRAVQAYRASGAGQALAALNRTPDFNKAVNEGMRERLGLGDMLSLASRGSDLSDLLEEAKIIGGDE